MTLFLIIDVALADGFICVASEVGVIAVANNEAQKNHSSWLHIALKELLKKNNISIFQIDVIAVTNGPGSYTGIRIGLSAVKGLGFALNKPIIVLNNLKLIAMANKKDLIETYIPIIDARRNEVFTTILDKNLKCSNIDYSMIIEENSFAEMSLNSKILICGADATKVKNITNLDLELFSFSKYTENELFTLTIAEFRLVNFTLFSELNANYAKEFFFIKNK